MNIAHREPARFTTAEFERLLRSGGFGRTRVELRRGLIAKMNPQFVPHGTVKRKLAKALEATLYAARLDWTVDQGTSVDFAEGFQPLPDIIVWDWTAAAQSDLTGAIPGQAVRLVVEVADSSLPDDLGQKREDYAKSGLAEYWVADVKDQLILQCAQPQAGAYTKEVSTPFGAVTASLAYKTLHIGTATLSKPRT
jgi:Uma2 family endonuclease